MQDQTVVEDGMLLSDNGEEGGGGSATGKRKRGRPKGSKNKKTGARKSAGVKRGPGRPKGSKNKNKSANGRTERGANRATIEKQQYIIALLRANPGQSINQSMHAIKKRYGKMISFERAKEAHDAFTTGRPIGSAVGPGSTTLGRVRSGGDGKHGYAVGVINRRGRLNVETFDTAAQVNAYVARLTGREGLPWTRIVFYQRFEPMISVSV
ncbi:MAG: hypothetical protein AB7K09_11990 [Planctomycetota bacterium]